MTSHELLLGALHELRVAIAAVCLAPPPPHPPIPPIPPRASPEAAANFRPKMPPPPTWRRRPLRPPMPPPLLALGLVLLLVPRGGAAAFAFQAGSAAAAPPPPSSRSLSSPTFLHLFGGTGGIADPLSSLSPAARRPDPIQGPRVAYPQLVCSELEAGTVDISRFPYEVDLTGNTDWTAVRGLLVRSVEDERTNDDIEQCVRMCVAEFGTPPPAPRGLPGQAIRDPPTPLEELGRRGENLMLSETVRLGMRQRVARRKVPAGRARPDHHVVCVSEVMEDGTEQLAGMAEVSLQVPDPEKINGPLVAPLGAKEAMGRLRERARGPAGRRQLGTEPLPYVSNVLVRPGCRGRGYARILMAAAEGVVRSWKRLEEREGGKGGPRRGGGRPAGIGGPVGPVYLHVDADSISGRAAQGLYRSLGYEAVADERPREEGAFAWMGADMMNTGLYMVDGVPLLYLRKFLK